jgi:hypothetical protein
MRDGFGVREGLCSRRRPPTTSSSDRAALSFHRCGRHGASVWQTTAAASRGFFGSCSADAFAAFNSAPTVGELASSLPGLEGHRPAGLPWSFEGASPGARETSPRRAEGHAEATSDARDARGESRLVRGGGRIDLQITGEMGKVRGDKVTA